MFRLLFFAALSGAAIGVSAQPAGTTAAIIDYRSAFDGYQAWNAQSPRNWREVNEEVERLGGHMGHLRASPAPPGNTPSAVPAANPPALPPHDPGNPGKAAAENSR